MTLIAARTSFGFESLEHRLLMARPQPSVAENVRFRLPLSSDVTTHYYFDRDDTTAAVAWNGTLQTYDGHKGTDFSGGPRGRAVFAAADGILIAKVDGLPDNDGTATGNGNYVRLNHGNDRNGNPINSVYLHFNAGTVTSKPLNSLVTAGEQIGGIGTSGHSTGLHLHFETQLARVAFDPYSGGPRETSWWVDQGNGSPTTVANTSKLVPGDPVEVYDLPGSTLNVRNPIAGTTIAAQPNGAVGTVLEGPTFGAFNNDYNNSLWVWYRVAWANGVTGWSTQNWLRKAVDSVAPVVQASTFQFEPAPQTLAVTFSENVGASLASSDLIVTKDGSTMPIAQTLVYDATTRKATLSFPGGVLADGKYHLRIAAGTIADAAGNALATEYGYDFHVLAGDANRDGRVDFADLVILAQNYNQPGRTFSTGNFDYSTDGRVDFADLVILAQHYNTSLVTATLKLATPTPSKHREPAIASVV